MINTGNGYPIGRFAGVEIRLNPNLLLIALLIVVQTVTLFRSALPTYSAPIYLLMGLITAGLFIGSVLWHELAHVMVAQRFGIPVLGVTLHMFGGVAQIARDAERPSDELWIAAAGPISSIILAIVFSFASGIPGIAGLVAQLLAQVNFVLAVFNLIPAFPMDGGRLLRAALWARSGSFKIGTRQAARVAIYAAGGFAVFAGLLVLEGAIFSGLWLLLIAYFVFQGATVSAQATAREPDIPLNAQIGRFMRTPPNVIELDKQIALAAFRYFDRDRDQAIVVLENGSVVGLLTYQDIERYPRLEWGKIYVREVMQRPPPQGNLISMTTETTVRAALEQFDKSGTAYAPVLQGEVLVGILFRRDLVYHAEARK